jgi:hypothetical protein
LGGQLREGNERRKKIEVGIVAYLKLDGKGRLKAD